MRKLGILVAVVLLGMAGLAASDVLILGTIDRIDELSFANSYDHFTWHILRNTTQALLTLEPGSAELLPSIAESWEISEGGKAYIFHIRPGITFWDNTPCDAHAVEWSLKRSIRLNGPKGGVHLISDYIEDVVALDDLTVKITLKKPDPTGIFLLFMTDQIAPSLIYSPKSTPEDEFANGRYAGTGPYKLVDYAPDEYVVLEAYDGFFGEPPKTKRIVWRMYSDGAALRAAIEAGEIDLGFRTFDPEDLMDLKNNPDLQVLVGPATSVRYILFNVTQPPVDDPFVRQAIAYAVDRDAIVTRVFSGVNTPIYTMVPKGIPPAGSSVDVFPKRDLERARGLLRAAGYSKENPLQVNLWFSPKHYGTTEADVAAVLKQSIEETGMVQINIQSLEWGAYVERMSQGGFDMFLLGWYWDYLEASNYLMPWTTQSPEGLGTFFNHHPNYQIYKGLFDLALSLPIEKRAPIYRAVQALSASDVPWIPLWANAQQAYVVARKEVKGIVLDSTMDLHIALLYKD